MTIRKKSPDILKQQKKSFINYIMNKEKYSKVIADLFLDDELEKIDDMESVKQHFERKWISKEMMDSLETDYESYLRWESFYWPIDDYPDDIKEAIKGNDKILSKIKNNIINEYKENKEFISLDIYKFIENNFWTFDEKNFKNIRKEISELRIEIKELKEQNNANEEIIKNLENEYWKLSIIKFRKKKEIIQKIEDKKNENIEIQEKIKRKEEEHKTKNKRECTIDNLWRINNINNFIWQKKWTDLAECKKSLGEIREEMSEYLNYIPEETFKHIVRVLYEKISDEKNIKKEKLEKMIDEYLNYFFTWENRYMGYIPTIYTRNKIDEEIINIIKELEIGYKMHTDIEDKIDYDFIDDVFIHTTWFRVLDEILEEWWLVSTNEANKRWRNNEDIKNSITQKEELKDEGAQPHKDIYFSRGFRKNLYWHNKSDDDYIFIANTMNNFANNGYWVPLNSQMQPDEYGEIIKNAVRGDHDLQWYSIISKSAIENKEQEDSYSKINIKDVYIFVCETKKKEIEWNSKYKTQGVNIIYFPEKYKWEMSYELYEFIKNEIAKREEKMQKRTPIPNKIITSEYGIESVSKEYQWAFCTPKITEQRFLSNPIKNWDYKDIINFLERIDQSEWLINFQIIEDVLIKNKDEIDNLDIGFKYPKELIILIILTLKIYKPVNWKIYSICKKIKEFWYSLKEVAILYETIGIIDSLLIYNEIEDKDIKKIIEWCDNWWIDVKEMENFVVKILNIAVEKKYADFFGKKFDDYRFRYKRNIKKNSRNVSNK